ncbi:MAG: hypothetical protein NTW86_07705 [Candidatus Sumerlaeota bacterium]|nr:hypothetical protein [Candidatus Sumerlaeota bacterium]
MKGRACKWLGALSAVVFLGWATMAMAQEGQPSANDPAGQKPAVGQPAKPDRPTPDALAKPQGAPERRRPEAAERGERGRGGEQELMAARQRVMEAGKRLAEVLKSNPQNKEDVDKAIRSLSEAIANGIRLHIQQGGTMPFGFGAPMGPEGRPGMGRPFGEWGERGWAKPGEKPEARKPEPGKTGEEIEKKLTERLGPEKAEKVLPELRRRFEERMKGGGGPGYGYGGERGGWGRGPMMGPSGPNPWMGRPGMERRGMGGGPGAWGQGISPQVRSRILGYLRQHPEILQRIAPMMRQRFGGYGESGRHGGFERFGGSMAQRPGGFGGESHRGFQPMGPGAEGRGEWARPEAGQGERHEEEREIRVHREGGPGPERAGPKPPAVAPEGRLGPGVQAPATPEERAKRWKEMREGKRGEWERGEKGELKEKGPEA